MSGLKPLVAPMLVGLVLASAAGAYSFARIIERGRPQLAFRLVPSLSTAAVAAADALVADSNGGRNSAKVAQARELARRSLIVDALNPGALRTLAGSEQLKSEQAGRLLDSALALSRRDIGTQLMEIEFKVARNNVAGALAHYDQALRVKPSVGEALYPVLLSAATDPELLPAIRRVVASNPPWLPRLAAWVVDNPDRMADFSLLIPAIPLRSDALSPDFGAMIVEGLANQNRLPQAYVSYLAYRQALNLQPQNDRGTYRPFDWAPLDSFEYGSEAVGNGYEIYANQNALGDVMRRLVRLDPGRYRFGFALQPIEGTNATITPQVTCPVAGGARTPLPTKVSASKSALQAEFVVPPNCRFQWLQIQVRAGAEPFRARLDRLTLSRIG